MSSQHQLPIHNNVLKPGEVSRNLQRLGAKAKPSRPSVYLKDQLSTESNYLFKYSPNKFRYIRKYTDLIDIICNTLSTQPFLGVDIENTNKTYEGCICLIQISYFDGEVIKTVVIDTIQIFATMQEIEKRDFCKDFLGGMVFENKDIVKIFHGSLGGNNGDIGWLQRDFGIGCNNVFDTQEFYKNSVYSGSTKKQQKKGISLSLSIFWAKYCGNHSHENQ